MKIIVDLRTGIRTGDMEWDEEWGWEDVGMISSPRNNGMTQCVSRRYPGDWPASSKLIIGSSGCGRPAIFHATSGNELLDNATFRLTDILAD